MQAVRAINTNAIDEAKALDARARDERRPRPAARHPGAARRRRSTRAACRPPAARSRCRTRCRRRTRRSSPSSRRRARSSSARRTSPSSTACSTRTCPRATRRSAARCCCRPTPTRRPPAPRRGSAAATAAGLAALTVGLETSTDTAQMIAPAGVAGVVGAQADGRRGVDRTACCRSPSRRTRRARSRRDGRATRRGGARARCTGTRRYSSPLDDGAGGQAGRRDRQHDGAVPGRVTALHRRGRDDRRQDGRHAEPNPASIVTREFKRDLNAYLAGTSGGAARCRGSSTTTPPTRSRA